MYKLFCTFLLSYNFCLSFCEKATVKAPEIFWQFNDLGKDQQELTQKIGNTKGQLYPSVFWALYKSANRPTVSYGAYERENPQAWTGEIVA